MSSSTGISIVLANTSDFPPIEYATERLITKKPLRLNPPFKFNVTGMEADVSYKVFMKLELVDGFLHKLSSETGEWMQNLFLGSVEMPLPDAILTEHHEGVKNGAEWMEKEIHFSEIRFSVDKAPNALLLEYKRFYKMSLVIVNLYNGHEEIYLDPRHCFRAVSNYSEKYAAVKPKVVLVRMPRKRPAEENGPQRAAKRAARRQNVPNHPQFDMGLAQPGVPGYLEQNGQFEFDQQEVQDQHFAHSEQPEMFGQTQYQPGMNVHVHQQNMGAHFVARHDHMWNGDASYGGQQTHFEATNHLEMRQNWTQYGNQPNHQQHRMGAYSQEQVVTYNNFPQVPINHQYHEKVVQEEYFEQGHPDVNFNNRGEVFYWPEDNHEHVEHFAHDEFNVAQGMLAVDLIHVHERVSQPKPSIPAPVSQEDMDYFNHFFVTPIFK